MTEKEYESYLKILRKDFPNNFQKWFSKIDKSRQRDLIEKEFHPWLKPKN